MYSKKTKPESERECSSLRWGFGKFIYCLRHSRGGTSAINAELRSHISASALLSFP